MMKNRYLIYLLLTAIVNMVVGCNKHEEIKTEDFELPLQLSASMLHADKANVDTRAAFADGLSGDFTVELIGKNSSGEDYYVRSSAAYDMEKTAGATGVAKLVVKQGTLPLLVPTGQSKVWLRVYGTVGDGTTTTTHQVGGAGAYNFSGEISLSDGVGSVVLHPATTTVRFILKGSFGEDGVTLQQPTAANYAGASSSLFVPLGSSTAKPIGGQNIYPFQWESSSVLASATEVPLLSTSSTYKTSVDGTSLFIPCVTDAAAADELAVISGSIATGVTFATINTKSGITQPVVGSADYPYYQKTYQIIAPQNDPANQKDALGNRLSGIHLRPGFSYTFTITLGEGVIATITDAVVINSFEEGTPGSGSVTPIKGLKTPADLKALSAEWKSKGMAGNYAEWTSNGKPASKTNPIVLANDIEMDGDGTTQNMTTIGTSRLEVGEFSFAFDGQGYTIKNLNMTDGLFSAKDAIIRRLNIDNATITVNGRNGIMANLFFGASIMESCTITNSRITDTNVDERATQISLFIGSGSNEAKVINCSASNITVDAKRLYFVSADADPEAIGLAFKDISLSARGSYGYIYDVSLSSWVNLTIGGAPFFLPKIPDGCFLFPTKDGKTKAEINSSENIALMNTYLGLTPRFYWRQGTAEEGGLPMITEKF